MSVAIIGPGKIGTALAHDLVDGGVAVTLAGRNQGATREAAEQIGGQVTPTDVATAIANNDIIVFAVWMPVIQELLPEHADALAGKIVVDPSNAISPDGQGGFTKTIPEDQSAGQLLRDALPKGASLVKAFGTMGAGPLRDEAHSDPLKVGFYAADDEAAGQCVAEVIRAAGFDPIYIGGIDESIRIEVFGDLHDTGKLGRRVTREEAEPLLAK